MVMTKYCGINHNICTEFSFVNLNVLTDQELVWDFEIETE